MIVVILLFFYVFSALVMPKGINATLAIYINFIFTLLVWVFKFRYINEKPQNQLIMNVVKLSVMTAIVLLLTNRFYGMSFLFDCMLCTAMFITIFQESLNSKNIRLLVKFTFLLFILNCLLSYYERVNLTNVFESQWQESWENDYHNDGLEFIFRSTALLGHPLNNALSTAIMMLMILVIPLKKYIKMLLWGMGLIALLCFNARGATICSVLFLGIYMIKETLSKHNIKTSIFLVFLSCLGVYLYGIISNSSLMGRLATGEVLDGSANERFRVWLPFMHMGIMDLLFGFTEEGSRLAFKAVRVVTMENWLAGFIYHMGIPFTFSFLILYYKIFNRILKGLKRFDRTFLFGGFIILSSLNNSLSMGSWPWIWTFCVFFISSFICSNSKFLQKNSKYFIIKT